MVMMAETHPNAPYDCLRPVRCRRVTDGRVCNAKGDNIDWSKPGIHDWRCDGRGSTPGTRCGAYNVVVIVEASSAQSVGPL
jgi:hypothetical protein